MSRWIDAEWLLNFFEPYPNDYQTPLGSLRACVDDAPSLDIEPKRGEWIEQEDCWQCSVCGDEYVLEVGVKPIDAKMNFCPNCGADMREREGE